MNLILRPVAAEFSKILTTRMWWILALVLFGYIALLAGGLAALFGGLESGAIDPDSMTDGGGTGLGALGSLPPLIYSFAASVGYVFPVLLGALSTTGEFRHQTLTPTFLATPKRGRVLGAKTIALFVVGAALGLVGLAASVGIGALVLGGFGVDPLLADGETWALIGRTVLAMALWAVIGVGLGVLAFTQFIEPLLRFAAAFTEVTADIGKFLPGAASDALVGASFFTLASPGGAVLTSWQGGVVLLGYGLVATAAGYLTSWKRDVT